MKHTLRQRTAFTLVELSIVLVILGLLTGGILVGQSLIRSAALREITGDSAKFINAVQLFQNEFKALPGDLSTATSYWGAADPSPATCVTTASTGEATCNGNGDNFIAPSTGSDEYFRFWQHLANAGLITGSYDGITHGSTNYSATAANTPTGKISNSGWLALYEGVAGGDAYTFAGSYGNALMFGGYYPNSSPGGNVLTPGEAYQIDVKMDDGKPGTGTVVALNWSTCTLAANNADTSAAYLLTSTAIACGLYFSNAF